MNRILLKISFSKNNLAAGNILKESLLRMPALMFNPMKYRCFEDKCTEGKRGKKKEIFSACSKKKALTVCRTKPAPCPPKPCKLPRYDCPPNDPPDHCPYKPPKCKKPCIDGKKPCSPPSKKKPC